MYCYWEEKFDVGHCLRDGQGGNGLQLENIGPTFSSPAVVPCKRRLKKSRFVFLEKFHLKIRRAFVSKQKVLYLNFRTVLTEREKIPVNYRNLLLHIKLSDHVVHLVPSTSGEPSPCFLVSRLCLRS